MNPLSMILPYNEPEAAPTSRGSRFCTGRASGLSRGYADPLKRALFRFETAPPAG
jgi:hypothetical protein